MRFAAGGPGKASVGSATDLSQRKSQLLVAKRRSSQRKMRTRASQKLNERDRAVGASNNGDRALPQDFAFSFTDNNYSTLDG